MRGWTTTMTHTVLEVRHRHLTWLSSWTWVHSAQGFFFFWRGGTGNGVDGCWHQVQRSLTDRPGPNLPSHIVPQPGAQLVFGVDPVRSAALSRSECTSWWPHSRVWRAGRAVTAGESTCWCKGRRSPCCRGPDPRCSRCLLWRRSSRPGSQRCTDTHRVIF